MAVPINPTPLNPMPINSTGISPTPINPTPIPNAHGGLVAAPVADRWPRTWRTGGRACGGLVAAHLPGINPTPINPTPSLVQRWIKNNRMKLIYLRELF